MVVTLLTVLQESVLATKGTDFLKTLSKIAHIVSALSGVILVITIISIPKYDSMTLNVFILTVSATMIIDNYSREC